MILLAGIVLCGCDINNQQDAVYWDIKKTIKYWDGQSIKDFEGKSMEAMLWLRPILNREFEEYFPSNYQVYKRFDDSDYQILLDCLKNPDKPRPSFVKGSSDLTSTLYLSFLDGSRYIIFFRLQYETAILQNGYSRRLYKLLNEKQDSSAYDPEKDPMVPLKNANNMMM
jgi:hypothetical protein